MDLGNIKVGDSLELHCYKHNGKINTVSDKITIIDIKDDNIYLIASKNGQYGVYKNSNQVLTTEYQSISYNKPNNLFVIEKKDFQTHNI